MEYLRECDDGAFDLAIVDPPYGIRDAGGQTGGSGKLKGRVFNNGYIDRWDKAPSQEYFDELRRVSKNQIIWGGNYFPLPPSRCIIVWDKVQPWENFSQVEIAWTSFDSPAQLFRFDNRTGDKIHPTQKPTELYAWLLRKYGSGGGAESSTPTWARSRAVSRPTCWASTTWAARSTRSISARAARGLSGSAWASIASPTAGPSPSPRSSDILRDSISDSGSKLSTLNSKLSLCPTLLRATRYLCGRRKKKSDFNDNN